MVFRRVASVDSPATFCTTIDEQLTTSLSNQTFMKNLSLIINAVLAIAIGVLFVLYFKDHKSVKTTSSTSTTSTTAVPDAGIAYVDLDTIATYYTFYKDKKAELDKSKTGIEASLKAKVDAFQKDAYNFQQNAANMTQSQGEMEQARLQQRQQQIMQERDDMTSHLEETSNQLLSDINAKMDTVIQEYTKDKHFSYVLTYTAKGGNILYRDKALDISKPVIDALNAKQKAAAEAAAKK
ncbi:MAG: hypothetical protein JWO03_1656 [Bacteroidetes bacterium]|nr:hypothetical protein [Bacteroidota bacterium]